MGSEGKVTAVVHRLYVDLVRPRIKNVINRQRLKLLWDVWGYWPLVFGSPLPPSKRFRLLADFLRVDWNVVHGHKPIEMSRVCCTLAERPARPGEAVVEAGCWEGGASAKLSLICNMLGYELFIYDSFQGVETMTPEEKEATGYDFSGEYAASENIVREHLARYGKVEVCTLRKGWFKDTLAKSPVPRPVRLAFIDCDLATGTDEALSGIMPKLVKDGWIFSQDFHIPPVRRLLSSSSTWARFGRGEPILTELEGFLASIRFPT